MRPNRDYANLIFSFPLNKIFRWLLSFWPNSMMIFVWHNFWKSFLIIQKYFASPDGPKMKYEKRKKMFKAPKMFLGRCISLCHAKSFPFHNRPASGNFWLIKASKMVWINGLLINISLKIEVWIFPRVPLALRFAPY